MPYCGFVLLLKHYPKATPASFACVSDATSWKQVASRKHYENRQGDRETNRHETSKNRKNVPAKPNKSKFWRQKLAVLIFVSTCDVLLYRRFDLISSKKQVFNVLTFWPSKDFIVYHSWLRNDLLPRFVASRSLFSADISHL